MSLFTRSKRQLLVYIILIVSFITNIFFISYGLINGNDLEGLAACLGVYDGTLVVTALGYLYAETIRPSGLPIIKNLLKEDK